MYISLGIFAGAILAAALGIIGLLVGWPGKVVIALFIPLMAMIGLVISFYVLWMRSGSH